MGGVMVGCRLSIEYYLNWDRILIELTSFKLLVKCYLSFVWTRPHLLSTRRSTVFAGEQLLTTQIPALRKATVGTRGESPCGVTVCFAAYALAAPGFTFTQKNASPCYPLRDETPSVTRAWHFGPSHSITVSYLWILLSRLLDPVGCVRLGSIN